MTQRTAARLLLVLIAALLTIPTYFVKVYVPHTLFAHHTRLLFLIWQVVGETVVVCLGCILVLVFIVSVLHLFKVAFGE